MPRQLFVLVSTGQGVANLPPVIECAKKEDEVVWIESDEARRYGWTLGPKRVLEQHGLVTRTTLQVMSLNNPAQIVEVCRREVDRVRDQGVSVVLVCNGGNKFSPIGVLRAWEPCRPSILYGDDKPAVLWSFPNGIGGDPVVTPYQNKNCLDLQQILTASGYMIHNPFSAMKLWPATTQLAGGPYGEDPQETAKLHASHHAWNAAQPNQDGTVPFKQLGSLLGTDRLDKWCRSLRPLADTGDLQNLSVLESVYYSTARLLRDAREKNSRQGLQAPSQSIGPAFETAVQRRVRQWADLRLRPYLTSIWANVKVATSTKPEVLAAEMDVVLVLRNGILFHVECKTSLGSDGLKDLDARLLNLQRAGSRLAQMVVCLPLYTQFQCTDWFVELHQLRKRIENAQVRFVPFTLPNQPTHYSVKEDDGSTTPHQCLSFEDSLDKLLQDYEYKPQAARRS